jgi:hypothetical protein
MFRRTCLAFGLALFSLSATAAKTPPLPMPVADDLQVELVLNQQELAVEVPNTANAVGMQFGLIGAIIGSAVQNSQAKKAEEAVVPLRDLLVEYRFNQRLEAALRAKLANAPGIAPKTSLTVMQTPWDAAQAHDAPSAMKAMVLVPRYAMDYNFGRLNVSLAASVVERTRKSNGKYKTRLMFNRTYAFDFPIVADLGGQEPVQAWTTLRGPGLAQLLDQGIEQTTDMLVHDLSAEGRAEWLQTGKGHNATLGTQTYKSMKQVRQGEGWIWVRGGKGYFHVLQGHRPLDAATMTALAATPAAAPAAADAPTAIAAAMPTADATTASPAAVPGADAITAIPAAAPAVETAAPTAEVAAPAADVAAPAAEAGVTAGQGQ